MSSLIVLLQYRVTPQATTGVSPSSLLQRQTLWIRSDLLKPQMCRRSSRETKETA